MISKKETEYLYKVRELFPSQYNDQFGNFVDWGLRERLTKDFENGINGVDDD